VSFRSLPGYTTIDGHRYVSIPTDMPIRWHSWIDEYGLRCRGSGDYLIRREPHLSRYVYTLIRDVDGRAVQIGITAFGRLQDAKDAACLNASGNDVVNWA